MKYGISIVAVAALMLAMAAPAMASQDYNGDVTIDTDTADIFEPRIGQGAALTTVTVASGGVWNTYSEMRLGEVNSAIINVQVGGEMNAVVELNDYYGSVTAINVYGTAFLEQLRMYGNGNHNGTTVGQTSTILVEGTLTVDEGLLGKKGIVEMTIGTNGTFICDGDFSIDSEIYSDFAEGVNDHGGYASFLNIVGDGRFLLLSTAELRAGHGNAIQGNGVLDNFVITPGTGDDAGYNVYTAVPEPATMSLLAIGGLAIIRRRKRA
jgi:hypothetical protein